MQKIKTPRNDAPQSTEIVAMPNHQEHAPAAASSPGPMTAKQRVSAALNFRKSDRVPRMFNSFDADFMRCWRERHGTHDPEVFSGSDITVAVADESPWPTRAGVVEERPGEHLSRNGWGWLERRTAGTFFAEMSDRALADRPDPDTLEFDDPLLNTRYEAAKRQFDELSKRLYVMCKTGGPYLRVAMMRGEEDFWLDIADDPGWVKAIIDRVADHITAVGVESIRRFGCQNTGIAIYDDCAANWGPFVSPDTYERLFLPALRRMIAAYKAAGAAKVLFHSDGNVLPLLDMWVDAGIDAINPIEYRLGMDAVELRARYGNRLACIGGVCNTEILPRGDRAEIRDHVQHLFEAARGGGFVIGTASISNSVPVPAFEYLVELLDELDPCRRQQD
jgi:uroporphyrinogen decarboxylase